MALDFTPAQIVNNRAPEGHFFDWTDSDARKAVIQQVPALGATRGVNVSDDYSFMNSSDLISKLQHQGYGLVSASQQYSRQRDPKGQEHVMRFRALNLIGRSRKVDDTYPEIVVMNSHNGRRALSAYFGLFRLVCSNGMVSMDAELGFHRVRHYGSSNTHESVVDVLKNMARKAEVLNRRIELLSSIMLTPHEQNTFAREVAAARGVPSWVEPGMVLEARRSQDERREDGKRSLWKTFNVLQENLTTHELRHEPESGRARSIRPIKGAMKDVLANGQMWEVLSSFADKFNTPLQPVRSFDEIMSLGTSAEMDSLTDDERAALTSDEKKKISSRKSYLKRKELVA